MAHFFDLRQLFDIVLLLYQNKMTKYNWCLNHTSLLINIKGQIICCTELNYLGPGILSHSIPIVSVPRHVFHFHLLLWSTKP